MIPSRLRPGLDVAMAAGISDEGQAWLGNAPARRTAPQTDAQSGDSRAATEAGRPQWARLSAAVCQFHAHKPGNRDGKEQWPNNRLQIGEAPRERIDRYDVPITGGRQRGEAEIKHGGDFVRIYRRRSNVGERVRDQLPDEAISRGEHQCEA